LKITQLWQKKKLQRLVFPSTFYPYTVESVSAEFHTPNAALSVLFSLFPFILLSLSCCTTVVSPIDLLLLLLFYDCCGPCVQWEKIFESACGPIICYDPRYSNPVPIDKNYASVV